MSAALFRPARTPLDPELVAACARSAPHEAWRLLVDRGALPAAWLDGPRRFSTLGHLPSRERAQRRRSAPYVPTAAHPDDDLASIASMWRAMEQAEAHARAFVDAAALWGMPRPDTILWMPISSEGYGWQIHDTKPGVWEPDGLVWRIFPEAMSRAHERTGILGPWLLGDEMWRSSRDRRMRERPSPFVPALALFSCGFGILPSSVDTIVLAYPRE